MSVLIYNLDRFQLIILAEIREIAAKQKFTALTFFVEKR